ncbi:hypothetical protein ACRRTK_022504 [Alexandromys fortis]
MEQECVGLRGSNQASSLNSVQSTCVYGNILSSRVWRGTGVSLALLSAAKPFSGTFTLPSTSGEECFIPAMFKLLKAKKEFGLSLYIQQQAQSQAQSAPSDKKAEKQDMPGLHSLLIFQRDHRQQCFQCFSSPSTAQYGITGSACDLFSCWSLVLTLSSVISISYLKNAVLQ